MAGWAGWRIDFIRLYEEPHLAREFGEEYATYVFAGGALAASSVPAASALAVQRGTVVGSHGGQRLYTVKAWRL